MSKSDAEYLTEVAHWPHILKMRAAVLGQLALKEVAPLVAEPIKEES